jgi:hypothetical protein
MVDRESTPVTHTFAPSGIDRNGVAKVTEYTGVPLAEPSLTLSRSENATTQKVKNRLVFRFPVVQTETINNISVPKVVREIVTDVTFTFHKSSTEQERNNAVGMFYSAFVTTKPLVHDLLVKNQAIY